MKPRSPIPAAALDMHMAILATSGAGKTVTAKGAVEDLLDAKKRVCIVDPIGNWYGLRTLAAGKPGYPVVIFGGKHADVPLTPDAGEAMAELLARQNLPAIIDASLMTTAGRARFFADFAEALMRENDQPLHLVVDEAHIFMPQNPPRDKEGLMVRCMYAGNNLVSGGRARGIATMLISQRASKVHKDTVTQCQTLVAMQNVHALDRETVIAFVKGYAGKETADEIEKSLAALQTGEGWIYSPKLGVLERVRFPMIRTLDTSDRPKPGEHRPPPSSLKSIDLEAIAAALKPAAPDAGVKPNGSPPGVAAKAGRAPERRYTTAEYEAYGRERFLAGRLAERRAVRRAVLASIDGLPLAVETAPPLTGLAARMKDAIEQAPERTLTVAGLGKKLKVKPGDGRWWRAVKALELAGVVVRDGDTLRAVMH
jgi:hypothetical protein